MFTYFVRSAGDLFYVENIFTKGRSRMYTNSADAQAVRDWLQFDFTRA